MLDQAARHRGEGPTVDADRRGRAQVVDLPVLGVVATAAASYAGQALAGLAGWPLWAVVTATLLPWVPVGTLVVRNAWRAVGWLAVYGVLVVAQTGHVLEHVAQMVQIHALGLAGAQARGVFGALDVEWVHFAWNAGILVATVALVACFPANRWLWATLVIAGWHLVEHLVTLWVYLESGVAGSPGILGAGGTLGAAAPFARPDLHFLYNLVETLPLVAGFWVEVRRRTRAAG